MLDHYSTGSLGPTKCAICQKHHYIPVFYLKNWADVDRRICEFSRPYRKVEPHRRPPKGTGFEYDHILERDLMKEVDQRASDVLRVLLGDAKLSFGLNEKVAWAQFILSLIQRTPERVAWLCQNFDRMRRDELARIHKFRSSIDSDADRAAFENFLKSVQPAVQTVEKALVIQAMTSLPNAIEHITKMRWHVVHVENSPIRLLTSDQPVVMSDGLQYANSYILFPISPAHVFVATNSTETELKINRMIRLDDFVSILNHHVCIQAERYVYDRNDTLLWFVENRLGKSKKRGTRAIQGSFPL